MTNDTEFKNELLKQNGIKQSGLSDVERNELRKKIFRQKIATFVLKAVTVLFWTATVIVHIIYQVQVLLSILSDNAGGELKFVIIILSTIEPFLIVISLFLTMYIYTRSKSAVLKDIQERLTVMENHNIQSME